MNQFRQNTLLVVSTQQTLGKMEVYSELKCYHPGIKLIEALNLLFSEYILFSREMVCEERKIAINLLAGKFLNLVELNMVKLTRMQLHSFNVLVREINSGHRGLTNEAFLQSLRELNLLMSNKYEYFGKLRNKTQKFILKIHNKPKRNHFQKFIGVGYKDKGTAKLESWDGFHSWQEVSAEFEARLDEIVRINSEKLRFKKKEPCYEQRSVEVDVDNFGNPVKIHLEKILIDSKIVAWREVIEPTSDVRLKFFHLLSNTKRKKGKSVSERLIVAQDHYKRYCYLECSL